MQIDRTSLNCRHPAIAKDSFFSDPVEPAFIRHGIERAVLSLRDIPEALALVRQQARLAHYLVIAAQHDVGDMIAVEAADEQVVLPFRDGLPAVEGHAAGRQHRVPVIDRLLHAFLLGDAFTYFFTAVLDAVADGRPAIVMAGPDK